MTNTFRRGNYGYPFYEEALVVTDPVTINQNTVIVGEIPSASRSGPPVVYGRLLDCDFLNKIIIINESNGTPYPIAISENANEWTSSYAVSQSYSILNDPLNPWGIVKTLETSDEIVVGLVSTNSVRAPIYSYDGYSWFSSSMNHARLANSVCWSPTLNRFVAVGRRTTAWYSDDGIYWTLTTSSRMVRDPNGLNSSVDFNACIWNSVVWDNNTSKFIAVGERENLSNTQLIGNTYDSNPTGLTFNTGSMMTSPDGINWTITKTVYTGSRGFKKVVNGNGVLVALTEMRPDVFGNTGTSSFHTSTNGGDSWTRIILPNTTNVVYDIAYSPTLNKFYAPYDKTTYNTEETSSLFFFTSSNGIDWGTYKNEVNPIWKGPYGVVESVTRITWYSGSQKFITNGVWMSDSNGMNFRNIQESDVAWGRLIDVPNNTIYNAALLPTTGSFYWGSQNANNKGTLFEDVTAWVEFDLNLDGGDPYGQSGVYVGTASLGIIIDSSSLSLFTSPSYFGNDTEEVMIDDIRYLRETDGTSEYYHYGYYERTGLTISTSSKSTFSASLKSAGRDYVSMWFGVYGGSVSDEVGLILNVKDGIVVYYEDITNAYVDGSFYMTSNTNLRFDVGPTLTDKGNGYWELSFRVKYDITGRPDRQYRTVDPLVITSSTDIAPIPFPSPIVPAQTFVEQNDAIIVAPRPDYWWRADYGLSTTQWVAVSGSLDFTLNNVSTASSAVGLRMSHSVGTSSVLPNDINAKHIFVRVDNIEPSRFKYFQTDVVVGALLGQTGSLVAGQQFHYFEHRGVYGVNANTFSMRGQSVGSYWNTNISGYLTGSKLIYTDFDIYPKPASPRPATYVDNWSSVSTEPRMASLVISEYKYEFTWFSGSSILLGRRWGDVTVEEAAYPSFLNFYIKELAIFTSSLNIAEAHAFSQEMLARWP